MMSGVLQCKFGISYGIVVVTVNDLHVAFEFGGMLQAGRPAGSRACCGASSGRSIVDFPAKHRPITRVPLPEHVKRGP